jgi:hypothetical protein
MNPRPNGGRLLTAAQITDSVIVSGLVLLVKPAPPRPVTRTSGFDEQHHP